jgi:hypothetical protein
VAPAESDIKDARSFSSKASEHQEPIAVASELEFIISFFIFHFFYFFSGYTQVFSLNLSG